jgi:FixJ family two-component response regulator
VRKQGLEIEMSSVPPVVHVIEDDESVRTAVVRLLRLAGFDARSYPSAGEFLVSEDARSPGCIVLDVGLPGMSGMDLHAALSQREDASVVFLTGRADVEMSVRAMKAGAVDFLSKPVKRDALIDAVQRALARDSDRRERHQEQAALQALYASLSPRERTVYDGVVSGKLNKQIAGELGTSIRTVKFHRARVMEKLGARSVPDLVRISDRLQGGARTTAA